MGRAKDPRGKAGPFMQFQEARLLRTSRLN